MQTLQQTILEKGIENVKIQFVGESAIRDENDAVCVLEKYWEDDDFSKYVHKVRCVSEIPYVNMFNDMIKNGYAYYLCDLEHLIEQGHAKILT